MAEFSFDHPSCLPRRPPVVLPHELVREILTWLPVKSLMRFKCVSRIWLSIITDPSFAVVYRGGFRGMIFSYYIFRRAKKKRFFYASLDFKGRSRYSCKFSRDLVVDHHGSGRRAMGWTEIVNGLLCFYYREYSYLFNPATREKLQLPSSADDTQQLPRRAADASKYKACSYHLGYDCVNKLYKLLKICPVYSDYPDDDYNIPNLKCEIISIGVDSSWRILHCCPPTEIKFLSRCINGVLYWLEILPQGFNGLVAFDLVEENFKLIPTPAPAPAHFRCLMFAPGLALIRIRRNGVSDTIYHYCDGIWKEQKVRLPSPSTYDHFHGGRIGPFPFQPAGILPSGEVLISERGVLSYPTYVYDPSKEEEEELQEFHRIFSSINMQPAFNEGYYHEENITPLKSLFTR